VKVQPLSWHWQDAAGRGRARSGLVLGYAASTATDIAEGIAILGDVLAKAT
jgi:GntR family transcriptional regulator / MocR family aminotransferase